MKNITIRPANIKDASSIANINLQSWCRTYKHIFSSDVLNALDLEKMKLNCLSVLKTKDKKVLLAEVNGIVSGYSMYGKVNPSNCEKFELFHLYLDPKAVGQGLGKTLLLRTKDTMKNLGGCQVIVRVASKNINGREFFEHCGCIQIGSELNYSIVKTGIDIACYELSLI